MEDYLTGGEAYNYDNYDDQEGPLQDWIQPSQEEAVAEQPSWEEQVELEELRRHRRANQERFSPTRMPKGFEPFKNRYSFRGPTPLFRRRTD